MQNLSDNQEKDTSQDNNSIIIKKHAKGIDYELVIHSFNDVEIKEITDKVDEFYENKVNSKKNVFDFFIK